MDEPKKISQDDRLKALALFVVANDHYRQLRQIEHALIRHLGQDDQGCISDAIYQSDQPASIAEFDEALKNDGFVVDDNAAAAA